MNGRRRQAVLVRKAVVVLAQALTQERSLHRSKPARCAVDQIGWVFDADRRSRIVQVENAYFCGCQAERRSEVILAGRLANDSVPPRPAPPAEGLHGAFRFPRKAAARPPTMSNANVEPARPHCGTNTAGRGLFEVSEVMDLCTALSCSRRCHEPRVRRRCPCGC